MTQQLLRGIEHIRIQAIRGTNGADGRTPTDKELLRLIRPLIPAPIKGEKGDSPTDSEILKLVKPLIPAPKNGKSPTKTELRALIAPLIPSPVHGVDGKDGSPDSPDTVVEKVNVSKILIDAERVRGLPQLFRNVEQAGTNPGGAGGPTLRYLDDGTLISAHVTELNFGTNLSATYDGNGRVTINATGGAGLTEITATGTINSSNVTFIFASVPTYIVADGVWVKATDTQGTNWSNVGTTITMTNPPSFSIYGF